MAACKEILFGILRRDVPTRIIRSSRVQVRYVDVYFQYPHNLTSVIIIFKKKTHNELNSCSSDSSLNISHEL